jgi:RNA polymerase sigma factor, sigma-70 family
MNKQYTNEELYKLSIESAKEEDRDYYKNELMKQNMKLLEGLAKEFSGKVSALSYEDAFSAALKGMVIAYEKFKPEKRIRFATFAYFVIQREICHQITGMNRQKRKCRNEIIYLDSEISFEDESTYHDILADDRDESYNLFYSRSSVNKILELITDEVNKKIIELHVLYEYTFEEIGKVLKMTRQGVYDRYKRTINKLKISYSEQIKKELSYIND